ncbi:hypothetical protein GMLC_14870 [Geomonas limicola]|uniref:RNA polymerase sigma-70 region 4 domain-containing protein n=1 Tax=Geomonas limicola TaxID=2740186 RepID=A0A6V8N5S2_9BACT|nr:hypothetical protein [Geomonas limicola]GFO67908.1 hypothetical protein GMLC_14870 [Geomonas limicola]
MALKPTWLVYLKMGQELSRHLDTNCTYEEIGACLGVSKQAARAETLVALGKLAYQLKKMWGKECG